MSGGRGVERSADRRRERGDGPLSLGRRLARRRGVSDPQARWRAIKRSKTVRGFKDKRMNVLPGGDAQSRRSAGLARLSLVRASARSSAGREARRLTASSALTRASWAPSAVLATERNAALAGSGWASRAATRFFKSASAGREIVERLPQHCVLLNRAFNLSRRLRKCGRGLGERRRAHRAARSTQRSGRRIYRPSSSSRQAARSRPQSPSRAQ